LGFTIANAKFFNPCGAGTWYATEYDPETRIFFGYVSIFGDWNDEWGSFALEELESYKGPLGIGIERDLYFGERRASEVIGQEVGWRLWVGLRATRPHTRDATHKSIWQALI
jgi:hypothetical protein